MSCFTSWAYSRLNTHMFNCKYMIMNLITLVVQDDAMTCNCLWWPKYMYSGYYYHCQWMSGILEMNIKRTGLLSLMTCSKTPGTIYNSQLTIYTTSDI